MTHSARELYGLGLITVSTDRILSDLREDLEDFIEKLKTRTA